MNSADEKIIMAVARLWVASGGDTDGFAMLWLDIQDAITDLITEKEMQDE